MSLRIASVLVVAATAVLAAAAIYLLAFAGNASQPSAKEHLIRSYALEAIVSAVESEDAEAFLETMAKHNLCRPLRDIPPECANAEYVEAVGLLSLHTTPNLRSSAEVLDLTHSALDGNSATLAFAAYSVERDDRSLLVMFHLAEPRSVAGGNRRMNAIIAWVETGYPSAIQDVWWFQVEDGFVPSVLAGDDGDGIPGAYRNVLYCDEDFLSGCPDIEQP